MMRAFKALLYLYPSSFRAEYGSEMSAIFARRRRDASGGLSIAGVWLDAIADTIVNGARAHWDILQQDVRYSARALSRSAGFTIAAVVVSALGIGATTAAFSITDHVLLRPLPFKDPAALVNVWQDDSHRGYARMELSPANFRDWQQASTSFDPMGAYFTRSAVLVGAGDPARLDGVSVTPNVLPMLGTSPEIGRLFGEVDDRDGAPNTILLSDQLWRSRFLADPAVVGRTISLNDAPYEVVGVMPPQFDFPTRDIEFWASLRFAPQDLQDRTDTYLHGVARLKRGVTFEQARNELRGVAARLERAYPKENEHISATLVRMKDAISDQSRLLLWALVGASLCVLLIACTNLANLLLARALVRRQELALRAAMGAGRERLVRQMLTESLLLALCGGTLGVVLAMSAAPLVARLVPNSLPIAEVPGVDVRMLLFSGLVTIVTGVGFGMIPALRGGRFVDAASLKENSRTGSGRGAERLRGALVVCEVAACLVLLITAGLLIRAMWRVQDINPGFRSDGVLTLRTELPLPKYGQTARRHQYYTQVLADVRALPGVTNAAFISGLPMVWRGGIWAVTIEGHAAEVAADSRAASLRYVTPGFFETAGVPVRVGRDLSDADTSDRIPVAVVSESFVRQYWPDQDPLGHRFRIASQDRTIVGVVGDVRVRGLERDGNGVDRPSEPQVYLPSQQVADNSLIGYTPKDLVVKSSLAPGALVPEIRRIIARVDPQLPLSNIRPLGDIVATETAPRLVQVRVLGAFAAIAFILAGIGIHGLLAFAVSSRTREIGVRIALGAQRRDIVAMVARQALVLAAIGVAVGVPIAYAASRAIQALLAGISPHDGTTIAAAVALAFIMTMAGSLLPALRAIRVNPIKAIRSE